MTPSLADWMVAQVFGLRANVSWQKSTTRCEENGVVQCTAYQDSC